MSDAHLENGGPQDVLRHLNDADAAMKIKAAQGALPDSPVPIFKLANNFGIRVWEAEMPAGLSGAIQKVDENYRIYTNTSDPETRQRFTCAHELAHFLLHKEHIGDGIREDILFRTVVKHGINDEMETQANQLAADILMPLSVVYSVVHKSSHVPAVAEVFNVSYQAVLVQLGIPMNDLQSAI